MKITIPKPCHEDWDKMTPKEQGSFCSSCAKIVVDFTKMKKEEIKQYFIDKKEEKTCGRFTVNQLYKKPTYERSFLSKFAFALYVVFGMTLFSCAQENPAHVVGEVEPINHIDTVAVNLPDTLVLPDSVNDTSTIVLPEVKGNVILEHSDNSVKTDSVMDKSSFFMGDVMAEPTEEFLGQPTIEIEEEPVKEDPPKTIKIGKVMIRD